LTSSTRRQYNIATLRRYRRATHEIDQAAKAAEVDFAKSSALTD